MDNFLISIVMPVYNAEKTLERAINSVIEQDYKGWELVIVNDGSTDKTLQIIEKIALKESRIVYHTINNSGCAKIPRDYAIKCSKGTHIVTLDSDDFLSSDYLSKLVSVYQQTRADIILAQMIVLNANDEEIYRLPSITIAYDRLYIGRELVKNTLFEWKIGMNGAFIDCKLITTLSSLGDNDVLMNSDEYDSRVFLINARKVAFSNAKYFYGSNSNSITRKISKKVFERLILNKKLQNLIYTYYNEFSLERILMNKQIFSDILSLSILFQLNKNSFLNSDVAQIHKLIKQSYQECQNSKLYKRNLSLKYKLLLSNYLLFVLIVKLRSIYVKR